MVSVVSYFRKMCDCVRKTNNKKKRQFIKNDTNDWAKSTVSKKCLYKKKTKKKRFIY